MKKITATVLLALGLSTIVSAQGAYIEFKMSGTGNSGAGITGSSKTWYQNGNARSEINMSSPQMPGGPMHRVTITQKEHPNTAYILNETAKTYTEMDLTRTSAMDDDATQYEVTVLGHEKVNGYNSTHVRVKRQSATEGQDMWVSTEVANYQQYMHVKSKYTTSGLFKALAAKGAAGFLVRVMVAEHGTTVQVDLIKSEMRSNDASLFSLDGYTKEAPAASPAGGSPADMQELAKKLQNMSPEERQQFINQIKQQQQQNPGSAPVYPK